MNVAKYGMVIDLQKCTGCRACMEACKVENNTSEGIFWMNVFRFEQGEFPDTQVGFLPSPCQHCKKAPCVSVCPTGSRFQRDDGLVLTDFKKCIGCRYCIVACPYGVNYFNWKEPEDNYYLDWDDEKELEPVTKENIPPWKNPDLDRNYDGKLVAGSGHYAGVAEKCTFCVHRLAKGLKPACVANCPTFAFEFGDMDDPDSSISQVLRSERSSFLREDLGTDPRVHYVGAPLPDHHTRQIDEPVKSNE